jgi:hypothetical protein
VRTKKEEAAAPADGEDEEEEEEPTGGFKIKMAFAENPYFTNAVGLIDRVKL